MYPILPSDTSEDIAWKTAHPDDLWALDKLILSRKLGHTCGPAGMSVPLPGQYVIRPCVNLFGMGRGAQCVRLTRSTNHIPAGFFWCEWFDGRHFSVDYEYGIQSLCVQGIRHSNKDLTHWDQWIKVDDELFDIPDVLRPLAFRMPHFNIEFIGGKVIEVHFRNNPDWELADNIRSLIPVKRGETRKPPKNYTYIASPDYNRVGFYVRFDDK